MILNIHDFPIKIDGDKVINCRGDTIITLSNQKELLEFIKETISAINDGKRVYKKRLTKSLPLFTFEEALDVVKTEMFEQNYLINNDDKVPHEVEYYINYGNKERTKIFFDKIIIDMTEETKNIQNHLESVLTQIIDAKEEANLTKENKEIALKDLIRFLNLYYNQLIQNKDKELKNLFTDHQTIWFYAINNINKKVKYPLLNIKNGLWRDYIITIFKAKGQEDLLTQLTGWTVKNLQTEKFTYDMKVLLLSINEILKENNNDNK